MPCIMNHAPVIETTGNASHYAINIGTGTTACDAVPVVNSSGVESVMLRWSVAAGADQLTTRDANALRFAAAVAYLAFESEL